MTSRDLSLIALFAGVIVAFGLIPPVALGFPVPITLQTLGVMLAGLVLGPKRGSLACVLVILLVAIGLPVLSGGRGGLGVFTSPTVGFLIGWVPGAFITGTLAALLGAARSARWQRISMFALAAIIGGIAAVYVCGILGLMIVANMSVTKAFFGSLIFIPGDLAKAFFAAVIAVAVQDAYPIERK